MVANLHVARENLNLVICRVTYWKFERLALFEILKVTTIWRHAFHAKCYCMLGTWIYGKLVTSCTFGYVHSLLTAWKVSRWEAIFGVSTYIYYLQGLNWNLFLYNSRTNYNSIYFLKKSKTIFRFLHFANKVLNDFNSFLGGTVCHVDVRGFNSRAERNIGMVYIYFILIDYIGLNVMCPWHPRHRFSLVLVATLFKKRLREIYITVRQKLLRN